MTLTSSPPLSTTNCLAQISLAQCSSTVLREQIDATTKRRQDTPPRLDETISFLIDTDDDHSNSKVVLPKNSMHLGYKAWRDTLNVNAHDDPHLNVLSFEWTNYILRNCQEQQSTRQKQSIIHNDNNNVNVNVNGKANHKMKQENDEIFVRDALLVARSQIDALESKMDDIWLKQENNDDDDDAKINTSLMPLLDFGERANAILKEIYDKLEPLDPTTTTSTTATERNNNNINTQNRRLELSLQVASELERLYKQHLDALRDYYGKRYEAILESSEKNDSNTDDGNARDWQTKEEEKWRTAAAHMTDGFRTAAQHSIPKLCRTDGPLEDADFNYVLSLQGLLVDMMEATQTRKDELHMMDIEDMEDIDESSNAQSTTKRRRPKTWYEKVAARALVMAVNYLQGWLAWQGVKHAAIQRDETMPKFPLF